MKSLNGSYVELPVAAATGLPVVACVLFPPKYCLQSVVMLYWGQDIFSSGGKGESVEERLVREALITEVGYDGTHRPCT